MTTYVLDFAEPLRGGFTIAPGAFNGPGGDLSATTLRLYGRGALEWGEAVNENLVRLAENFSGATPPTVPVAGQLWLRQKLYIRDTTVVLSPGTAPDDSFFRYVFEFDAYGNPVVGGDTWVGNSAATFEVTVIAGSISGHGDGAVIGEDYVWSVTDGKLYRWDIAYKQAAPTWLERSHTEQIVAPVDGTTKPVQSLLNFDQFSGEWTSPETVHTSTAGDEPANPSPGNMWYNLTSGGGYVEGLYVWNGTEWVPIAVLGDGTSFPNQSHLNMGGNRITNVGAPVDPDDAATMDYVDTAVDVTSLQATLDSVYVNVAGDTMTGVLVLDADPVNPLEAATKQYVDAQFGQGGSAPASFTSGTPAHKPGDIYVESARIWIAVTTATSAPLGTVANPGTPGSDTNWKHVFPAQWV